MSSSPSSATDDTRPHDGSATIWARLDHMLDVASERLNPILVKEARQALKSRQFVITFSLLLCFGWGWTVLGLALLCMEMGLTGVFYAPSGRFMLIGYYVVLAIPMLVVVPFSAFRSLASEREDGTFELLSITTLSSRQIISGKLGSALLQMMVYYSALSPCIAFTYLLRGVDIVTILFVLFYTFLGSLALSVFGLMVATVTRSYHWQVFLSVILLGTLFGAAYAWSTLIILLIVSTAPLDEPWFWITNLASLSFYVSFLVLCLETAGSQLSFASDNRSTRLRIIMLVQQMLLIGWVFYGWCQIERTSFLAVLTVCGSIYWAIMGTLMIGESGELSPRAMRRLPQSFLGRSVLTWFNPGSGTGYVFAVSNLLICVLLAVAAGLLDLATGGSDFMMLMWFSLMVFGYVTAYLGATRLIVLLIRRVQYAGIAMALLIHIILLLAGAGIPFFLDLAWHRFQDSTYTIWQSTNWILVLYKALEEDLMLEPAVPVIVLSSAALIFLVNLVLAGGEVERVRQETPKRVLQDDRRQRREPAGEKQSAGA